MGDFGDRCKGGFYGMITGDALGVPVEFKSRASLSVDPVTGMRGEGSHMQPAGTWSDDTSMMLATIDSLSHGYDPLDMIRRFCDWFKHAKYTPHGEVFDIGDATREALEYFLCRNMPQRVYGEFSNGNGSLMRILPLPVLFHEMDVHELYRISSEVSSLTHGHERSCLACGYYSLMIKYILDGMSMEQAYSASNNSLGFFMSEAEARNFSRITDGRIATLKEYEIQSTGYVVSTLEAALWCCLTSDGFDDAVLKAVNLGDDTDTVAAVAGGIAGVYYGLDAVPVEWTEALANKEYLDKFADMLVRAKRTVPDHYNFMRSIQSAVGEQIKGLGVVKTETALSEIGGICRCNYIEQIGKPEKIEKVLAEFRGMNYLVSSITLDNGWILNVSSYQGFNSLKKGK